MLVWRLKMVLAPLGWRLWSPTWRVDPTGLPAGPVAEPVIFACLHRDILPAIRHCRPARPVLLISRSPDGEILRRTLARDGFGFVRGSTGHHGGQGFVGLLRALRRGHHVGVAVDGPRGPFGQAHEGVLHLARRAGAPIIPLQTGGRGCVALRTWDRTRLPLPGASLRVVAGTALRVPASADRRLLDVLRRELERRLLGEAGGRDADP